MLPDPYFDVFAKPINLHKVDLSCHWKASLKLFEWNGRLILRGMDLSTPTLQIPCWQTQLQDATLIKVGDVLVSTVQEVHTALAASLDKHPSCPILFAFLKFLQDILHDGLPIMNSSDFSQATNDQLNNQWDYFTLSPHMKCTASYLIEESGDVLNYVTRVMCLTWGGKTGKIQNSFSLISILLRVCLAIHAL
jgi:hypothetical protein